MSMAQIAEHLGALAISPWKANDFPWVVVGFPLCAGKSARCLRMCYLFWRSYSKLNKNDTSYPQTTKMRSSNDLSCSWPMLPIKQLTNGRAITVIETAVWVSLLIFELSFFKIGCKKGYSIRCKEFKNYIFLSVKTFFFPLKTHKTIYKSHTSLELINS